MTKQFKGVIKLDVRDSKADWTPYVAVDVSNETYLDLEREAVAALARD
jgi:hypothetical protein